MNFLNKSLNRRFAFFASGLLVVSFLGIYLFFGWNGLIDIQKVSIILALCFIVFGVFYYREVVRPFKIVLYEMKALLTGQVYKKILTDRIDEIGVIAHFFNEVTKSFERVSGQLAERKRMMNELEVAGHIQKDILPPQNPQIPGLDIVAKTRPCVELGGDTFDFISVKDNHYIYIGDVTGHGVPAAMVMTMVHTLIRTFVEMYASAMDVLVNTNRRLKSRIRSTMFMTLLMLRWNSAEKKMYFVGAGHEHLMIYRAKTNQCEVKPTGGIALGMVPDNSKLIKEVEVPLEIGDVIVLYSDGITEARNMTGEMYSLERLKVAVERFATQYQADGIMNHVAQDFSHFVGNHVQEDDISLIAIRYAGDEQPADKVAVLNTAWSAPENV